MSQKGENELFFIKKMEFVYTTYKFKAKEEVGC